MRQDQHSYFEKFSTAMIVSKLRSEQEMEDGATQFAKCAEEIRSYLAVAHGQTDDERKIYNERLNRAVLGYSEDRTYILAIVDDRLLRLRIHHIENYDHPYPSLAHALFAEVIGMSVLELILRDREGLEEIQVVGNKIFEIRQGKCMISPYTFDSYKDVERIQQNLVLYNNDRINARKKWAEVMLRDGTRVTMTSSGYTSQPTLTMRFYTVRHFNLDTLCDAHYATINRYIYRLLQAILKARLNIVLIGPTNSGKTHLMKALISELPDEERLITIESRRELMLQRDFPHKNAIEYEVSEDDELHHATQAFKLALRQSPQRIIHAEIRDDDANIYVRACTRGHEGSMTTLHVSTLEDVPEAITDMCMLDGRAMNPQQLTKRIAQYVTQIGIEMRMVQGKRRLVRLSSIVWRGGEVVVEDWAKYDVRSNDWMYPHQPSAQVAYWLNEGEG